MGEQVDGVDWELTAMMVAEVALLVGMMISEIALGLLQEAVQALQGW